MKKALWFDMDGTIYPLYKQTAWLERLIAEDASVFAENAERKNLDRMRKAVQALKAQGWFVGVVTWLPKEVEMGSAFGRAVEVAKQTWLLEHFPELATHMYCMEYGQSKREYVDAFAMDGEHWLVDDNKEVRKDWRSQDDKHLTINASRGFVKQLEALVV